MRCLNCGRDGIPVSVELCPQCGVYLPSLLRDVLPPSTLLRGGTYRIDYALGRGGFGITYRAMHVALEQLVAIKEFYPQEYAVRDGKTGHLSVSVPKQDTYQRGLKRFVREGQILAKLNHQNVVRVQDFFEERGTAYLVMELLSGHSLRDELDAQPLKRLPLSQVMTVMNSLIGALEKVHQLDVYHLDLSPDNVLLTPEGRVVLVDFGAAKQGLGSKSTQAFKMAYAPVEVIAGQDVGPESDLFELGMMLYEMLTGELPTPALGRLREDSWKPKRLEDPWQTLVESALQLQKEKRPKTVKAWWQLGGKEIADITVLPPRPLPLEEQLQSLFNSKEKEVAVTDTTHSSVLRLYKERLKSLIVWWQSVGSKLVESTDGWLARVNELRQGLLKKALKLRRNEQIRSVLGLASDFLLSLASYIRTSIVPLMLVLVFLMFGYIIYSSWQILWLSPIPLQDWNQVPPQNRLAFELQNWLAFAVNSIVGFMVGFIDNFFTWWSYDVPILIGKWGYPATIGIVVCAIVILIGLLLWKFPFLFLLVLVSLMFGSLAYFWWQTHLPLQDWASVMHSNVLRLAAVFLKL